MEVSSHNALQGCVSSLRSSMQLLESTIYLLDAGVSDYPRLTRVLKTTKHFELVSEPELVAAQSSLLSEIQPEVQTLLSRVETYLDKLERREQSLIAKAELQSGRLTQTARGSSAGRNSDSAEKKGDQLSALEEAKLKQLVQKKERLSYAVSKLELQAGLRQRELRKSMAVQNDAF